MFPEKFKAIPSTNGRYQASRDGDIRRTPSLSNPFPAMLPYQSKGAKGPYLVEIARQGRIGGVQKRSVGRLVLEAFVPNPAPGSVTTYVDGNAKNVGVHNLAWRPRGEVIKRSLEAKRVALSHRNVRLAINLDGRTRNAVALRLAKGESSEYISFKLGVGDLAIAGVKQLIDGAIQMSFFGSKRA